MSAKPSFILSESHCFHRNLTWKLCAESLFWNILLTDFAAAGFHLGSLPSQTRRRPLHISEPRFQRFLEPPASPAACGKVSPPCPQSPFPWADRAACRRDRGRELPFPTSRLTLSSLIFPGGEEALRRYRSPPDQLPGRRRHEESLKGGEQ